MTSKLWKGETGGFRVCVRLVSPWLLMAEDGHLCFVHSASCKIILDSSGNEEPVFQGEVLQSHYESLLLCSCQRKLPKNRN